MNRFPFPPYHSGIPHWTERVVSYCAKVLPIVFDNSLSYYEFLGHMQVKLNEVIKALNSQNLVFVEFTHMIELELQNFEKYMEDRQDNFEQQMQDEWQAFKTEMETAWNDFKTQMEQEWQEYQDEMNEAWNDFKQDLLQRFQTFQDTITAQQTAFEQRMEAVQQQFEDDMENRADTFEQTLTAQQNAFEQNIEQELEDWKDIAIRAILDTIRQELPDMIEDVVSEEIIEPVVKQEIARNGFAKILSASNLTAGDTLDLTSQPLSIYDGGVLRGDSLTIADLANVEIKPNTSIVFTSQLLWRNVGNIRALVSDAAFPASGWRLQIGKYTTQQAIGNTFDIGDFTELVSTPLSDSSTAYYANSNAGMDAGLGYYQYVCIRFAADPSETSFTCDYSAGVEFEEPRTADLVVQSELNGTKYSVPKITPVDQTFDSASANAQSGVAVSQAIAAGKMTKIFSETFSYQWLTTGTDLVTNFTQTLTTKNNTVYLVLIYAADNSNEIMGSIFMTKGSGPLAAILKSRTAIQYYDNPNIVTGLASLSVVSGSHPQLTLKMPTISTASGNYTGRLEIYEIPV